MTPFYATMTRRWHTNPHLSHTHDSLASHGGRMAVLTLDLWPQASRDLLAACVTHDLGEYKTGDRPFGCPDKDNDAEHDALKEMGLSFDLIPRDQHRLRFLDRLDAYLWARHHASRILKQPEWRKQFAWLIEKSLDLDVDVSQYL